MLFLSFGETTFSKQARKKLRSNQSNTPGSRRRRISTTHLVLTEATKARNATDISTTHLVLTEKRSAFPALLQKQPKEELPTKYQHHTWFSQKKNSISNALRGANASQMARTGGGLHMCPVFDMTAQARKHRARATALRTCGCRNEKRVPV